MAQKLNIKDVLKDKELFKAVNGIAARDGLTFNEAMQKWYAEQARP